MNITFIEIQNFRKLKSVRIDFSKQTTLLVGANNSGKTSATLALRHFLVEPEMFSTNAFTLSNWGLIETIAAGWEVGAATQNAATPSLDAWDPALPSLDVWLEIGANEIHYVRRLLPTLDWAGGALGVRLRFEPKAVPELYKDYLAALRTAKDTKLAGSASFPGHDYKLTLWPENMRKYLDRHLQAQFAVRAYLLDPAACVSPVNGIAKPQSLPNGIGPIEGNPLSGLIRVNAIAAQRGLGEQGSGQPDADGQAVAAERRPLSEQLRAYYARHLDPAEDERATKSLAAVRSFLNTAFAQIKPYADYIRGDSPFTTHQGVKGLEFPRVVVILDDEDARGFLFSFEKLFGAKEKTAADIKNEREGNETGIDRTRRLFYVTCSRTQHSLALMAYSTDPMKVRDTLLQQGWFDDSEIEVLK